MWYMVVRGAIIIVFLVLILLIIFLKRMYRNHKVIMSIVIAVFAFISYILCVFPIENYFITFKTPSDVCNYYMKFPVKEYIYNNDSCMAIGGNSGFESFVILPKDKEGYKIPYYFQEVNVANQFGQYGYFEIYTLRNTNDYYICGSISFVEEEVNIEVCDGSNLTVRSSEKNDLGYKTIWIYGAVNYSDDFFVIVNGEKVSLASSQS